MKKQKLVHGKRKAISIDSMTSIITMSDKLSQKLKELINEVGSNVNIMGNNLVNLKSELSARSWLCESANPGKIRPDLHKEVVRNDKQNSATIILCEKQKKGEGERGREREKHTKVIADNSRQTC